MKIKNIVTVLLIAFILASCAPAVKVVPTETAISTLTFTPIPTATITSTPIPIIDVEGQNIPDPRFSNPDFFDVTNAKSPIVQFAKAFDIQPNDVISGLNYKIKRDINGSDFVVASTSSQVVLLLAIQNGDGQYKWEKVTPSTYSIKFGKFIGLYEDGDEFNNPDNKKVVNEYFQNGILALGGQVRPNAIPPRPPSNANRPAEEAQRNHMSLFIHYVAEPGKFPTDVNTTNIDSWLDSRFEGFAQVIKTYKAEGQPMFVTFNEAWEGNTWNEEANPIKDKYGNQWVEEYVYQILAKFIGNGLTPQKDFILVFNDGNMYNRPAKQDLVYKTLLEARTNAFNRLISEPDIKIKLETMGINQAENIEIWLGAETETQLDGKRDDGIFVPPPTNEEIVNLSKKFEGLGGLLMTEIEPVGTTEQQAEFIRRITSLLPETPNFKGIIWFNIFKSSDDTPDNVFGQVLEFFDASGVPTKLYYELLRH